MLSEVTCLQMRKMGGNFVLAEKLMNYHFFRYSK